MLVVAVVFLNAIFPIESNVPETYPPCSRYRPEGVWRDGHAKILLASTSAAQPIAIAVVSPGIFTLNQQGTGAGAVLHAVDFQPVSESAPGRPGEFLLIFCTGLGPVQPEVQSGDVASNIPPLAETLSTPLVDIASIPAQVTFSGLTPGFVGLYQVNVQVPVGFLSGTQSVEIIINGVPSNTVTIAVE